MTTNWSLGLRPLPYMSTWNTVMDDNDPEMDHCWITHIYLNIYEDVPGIPPAYRLDQEAGRAIYCTGLPFSMTIAECTELFNKIAPVKDAPILVSLGSQHTFRWVIFHGIEGAKKAIEEVHGIVVDGKMWRVSKALRPGRTISLLNRAEICGVVDEVGEEGKKGEETSMDAFPGGIDLEQVNFESECLDEKCPGSPAMVILASSGDSSSLSKILSSESIAIPTSSTESFESTAADDSYPELGTSPDKSTTAARSPTSSTAAVTTTTVPPVPFSWAKLASAPNPEDKIINLHPPKPRIRRSTRIASISSSRSASNPNTTIYKEPIEDQKRVVFLLNLPNTLGLQDISNAVHEGPLVQIVFAHSMEDKSRYCGVVFKEAYDAQSFFDALERERRASRPGEFRFIVDAHIGELFPMNDDIKAMGPPTYATRRLTIVKAKFFFMFKEEHLLRLCEKEVGAENVQLVWLYNGGNATVVFADVGSSIRVKECLEKKAAGAGKVGGESEIWMGLVVSFSKDPCVVPLELKTALCD